MNLRGTPSEEQLRRAVQDACAKLLPGADAAVEAEVLNAVAIVMGRRLKRPAEIMRRKSAELLKAFYDFGGDRLAAGKVARKFAPLDPAEQLIIAQRVRRLARGQRKTNAARLPE